MQQAEEIQTDNKDGTDAVNRQWWEMMEVLIQSTASKRRVAKIRFGNDLNHLEIIG